MSAGGAGGRWADVQIVPEASLHDPRTMGGRLRAYCHLHGGDHQRSLSIALDGDAAGFGLCHACGAKVFVPDLNPDAAARMEQRTRGRRLPGDMSRRRVPTPAELLRRPKPATAAAATRSATAGVPPAPVASEWQRYELRTLAGLAERMRARLTDERAAAYLGARGIPLDIAAAAGVGYIPADARLAGGLAKWRDRLVFPLGSRNPAGVTGYIGRSLYGWQPGMDENAHKALLDAKDRPAEDVRAWGHRWEKTNPAGWLGYDGLATAAGPVVIVEGAFDALALFAAGVPLGQLVALAGTAARAEWIPANVRAVVLALDGDDRGRAAAATLRRELRAEGLDMAICVPPAEDGRGKDWCERWRVTEWQGVAPVFDALDALAVAEHPAAAAAVSPAPVPSQAEDAAARPWLHDVIVCELLRRGMVLAEARMLEPVPSAAPLAW